jgi:hypothetical protein
MKMKSYLALILCLTYLAAFSQKKNDSYRDGYVIRGNDTIKCKILDNQNQSFFSSVTVLIDENEFTFTPTASIKGFGFTYKEKEYHFGCFTVDIKLTSTNTSSKDIFAKNFVAGTINLFEHSYSIFTTKRTTANGIEQPGSTSTSQHYTNYYISKSDPLQPGLSTPTILYSFNKKNIEPYISDNIDLLNKTEKKLKLEEVINCIKEYNDWCKEKK